MANLKEDNCTLCLYAAKVPCENTDIADLLEMEKAKKIYRNASCGWFKLLLADTSVKRAKIFEKLLVHSWLG
jgi:hypothetical protein